MLLERDKEKREEVSKSEDRRGDETSQSFN